MRLASGPPNRVTSGLPTGLLTAPVMAPIPRPQDRLLIPSQARWLLRSWDGPCAGLLRPAAGSFVVAFGKNRFIYSFPYSFVVFSCVCWNSPVR